MSTSALLDETDVKVVYDQQGNRREVLLSYEKYQEMLEFIERYAYFYSQEVQERLQRANEDLAAGRYITVEADNVDAALEWLHG
ncbi:MAG TPA: hypothetical protein PKZ84_07825 [Anaerolineae bacterium]|nr:hypothetical protein [Anaerolineae bacterium]HQI84368.1 hypothetical protein [Anaerolineae bacterium]